MDVDRLGGAREEVAPVAGRAVPLLTVAAAAWLGFVAAHWILNGRWWGWLFPSALPPVLFVVVPVVVLGAALLVRPARRRVIVPAALALALGVPYSGLNPAALWPGDRTGPAGALRVFSWNTEYWHQQDDPDEFYRFLKAQRADVYLLQEYLGWDLSRPFDGEQPLDDLARLRREFPGYHIAARSELLTLSRLPIVAQPPVAPDPAAAGDDRAGFHRVFRDAKVLRTDLRWGTSTVSFYNAHIAVQLKIVSPLTASFWTFPHRAAQQRTAQLRGLVEDVVANPHPVVVAGDFNTSPAMADLDELSHRLHDPTGAGSSLYPSSWTPGGPLSLWRLDWTFVSSEVDVHRYEFRSPRGMSDHHAQDLSLSLA
jgi:endonuclease/exonuclease/phosphatase (EEP) superfamily protein YafD